MYSGGVFFMLKSQQELNFSQYTDLYDKLIPQNHLFRKINELMDFSFIKMHPLKTTFLWGKSSFPNLNPIL